MINGIVPDSLWDLIDVDYHDILAGLAIDLQNKYADVKFTIQQQFDMIDNKSDRTAFAEQATKMNHTPALFAMLDNSENRVDEYIMNCIRPKNNIIN